MKVVYRYGRKYKRAHFGCLREHISAVLLVFTGSLTFLIQFTFIKLRVLSLVFVIYRLISDFGIVNELYHLLIIFQQMSAAAFAKGLLDLEGQLTPILVCSLLSEVPFRFVEKYF